MKRTDLIKALGRLKIETGSIACLGCGHEHNCSTQGCAIIRAAVEELKPPADVRPIVKSHWEISCDGWYPYCPACGAEPPGRAMTPFCPMCGADMRGA